MTTTDTPTANALSVAAIVEAVFRLRIELSIKGGDLGLGGHFTVRVK
jgi:hypothetical protein